MPRTYVVIDLETTGLDPEFDAIIEVGAIRFSDTGVLDKFSSHVRPGRAVSAKILHLTGIDERNLQNAPPASEVVRQLARFVGDDIVVGHSVEFDIAFLAKHGVLTRNRTIDTFELSTILMPHASRHSLSHLARDLDLDLTSAHRALADADATMKLFLQLKRAAKALPLPVLRQIADLGKRGRWRQGVFFADVIRELNEQARGMSIGQQLFAKGAFGESPNLPRSHPLEAQSPIRVRSSYKELDVGRLRTSLEPGGELSTSTPSYEHRPEQVEMLDAVGTLFNEGGCLLVEAGTGVGKSLAYTIPAVVYSHANNTRVVISTNTINLQEQLYAKDIPQVADALGLPVRVAVLKGRNNYLCLFRLRTLQGQPTLSKSQALALAKVLAWLPGTTTGDRSELSLNTPAERQVWQQICSDSSWCAGELCPDRQNGSCFFHRARSYAENAHLVVVNHSLLAADSEVENRILPEYDHLIVDEAHQLENAATRFLHMQLTTFDLRDSLRAILRPHGSRQSGFLPLIAQATDGTGKGHGSSSRDIESATEAILETYPLIDSLNALLRQFARVKGANAQEASTDSEYTRRRLTPENRNSGDWRDVVLQWKLISRQCRRAMVHLEELYSRLRDANTGSTLYQGLGSAIRYLRHQVDTFDEIIASPSPEHVYWLSVRQPTSTPVLNCAPISVASRFGEALFGQKRCVILTSATLSTDGSFDYFAHQIGATGYAGLKVGSPFDYRHSTLVCTATDIPEPRQPGHQRAIERSITRLAAAVGGKLMALFTSRSQLRATTRNVTRPLESAGILTYSQSDGVSRSQLLESFMSSERAVLLGTRSFWEGVDIPGNSLKCLVMVKLPFPVPDDPVTAARSEQYSDPFNEYLLPEAILTFRQGFGRLIRSKTDRGVFVILDSRVRSRRYGSRFLRALPDCTFYDGTVEAIAQRAVTWLSDGTAV